MSKISANPLHWVRLDNAAKIYPAARRRNWSNLFRQSVTLKEDVDTEVLHSALEVVIKRFPSIAACLQKGMFWYYLQQVRSTPEIKEEYSYPLVHMNNAEMRKCAFRVIVHRNRIAIEFFHSLTDGTGALIFLKNLTAEYLEQKYGVSIPLEHGILDRKSTPSAEELEDCFPKNAGPVPLPRKDTNAWQLDGEAQHDGFLNVTCFKIPVNDAIQKAHEHGATLTVFMSAVMMKALLDLQNEKNPHRKHQKRVKLLIPVNLRKLYGAKTLRNFAMYVIPELDPRLGEYDFDEICKIITHKLGAEFTAKHMSRIIAANVGSEQNPIIRVIPLPIKNIVMKAVFNSVGEIKSCLTLSNMGAVKVPDVMAEYVERFDFILGVQATAPYNCGMLSYGDTIYLNFIRDVKDAELERHFWNTLQNLGLSAEVESNRNER